MPFLGIMLVSTHKAALRVAKAEAFSDGHADARATAPKPIDRQPMINSLQGQLDAAVKLKDDYARTIGKCKRIIDILKPDADKWQARLKADRERQRKLREKANSVSYKDIPSDCPKSKAGAKK